MPTNSEPGRDIPDRVRLHKVNIVNLKSGFCMNCNYDLESLSLRGNCPECGQAYTENSVLLRPLPGSFLLCLYFGWPLLILTVSAIAALEDILIAIPICLFTLVFQVIYTVRASDMFVGRYASIEVRANPRSLRLKQTSAIAKIIFLVAFCAPFLFFGGCFVLSIMGATSP